MMWVVLWFVCSVFGIGLLLVSRAPAPPAPRWWGLTDEIVNQRTLTDDILNPRKDQP